MRTTMHMLAAGTLALASTLAGATTLSGNLGDSGNGALVGSDLGAPDFTDANAVANNVALYTFDVTVAGTVDIVSSGFGAGGVHDSNYAQAISTGGDFTWSGTLGVGSYEIALGSFENMSFAENLGSGTLGDGFIFLGDPNSLGNGSYSLTLTTPVSEPEGTWLMGVGLAVIATRAWRARRA
jgi:hypothetical protein